MLQQLALVAREQGVTRFRCLVLEENRVVEELSDGAVIYEQSYAGENWLIRAILSEAGGKADGAPPTSGTLDIKDGRTGTS